MLLKIDDQIELNYKFNKYIFDNDVDIVEIDDIVEIIKNIVNEFNENNDIKINYDDIFLNVDVDEIIKRKIRYTTNLLYKIFSYHDNKLINISYLYDPENNYNYDVDIVELIKIYNEFNDIEINENIFDEYFIDEYDEYNNEYIFENEFELIDYINEKIDDIVENIINEIDDELNKTYNKDHHITIKSIY